MINSEVLNCLQSTFPGIEWRFDEVVSFLKTVNLMNPGGSVYKEREKKMYEVIHFSSHVVKCIRNISRKREITLLDCGCGRSYLSFFVNYVLRKMGRSLEYTGVDSNSKLIERSLRIRDELGFTDMQFSQSKIIEFDPKRNANVVCALHACDTATDEAIAKGINLRARYVIVAPCCQRQIVRQLNRTSKKIRSMKPLLETKISREYVGVALTETLRKLCLECFGYKVDIFEFISPKYTPKNIMLRAEKMREWNNGSFNAYQALRDYFNVKPKIQEYLVELVSD